MGISYKKLWKLLIDKGMKKGELREKVGISQSTMAKLAHNQNVTTDVLVKICYVLQCDIGDIAEIELTNSEQDPKDKELGMNTDE